MFHVERVYGHLKGPGKRILVDRLWPRGIQKSALKLDGWLKDLAPSNELRKWFHHDPAQYEEFTRRYTAELEANPDAWAPLLEAGRTGDVTLLFSAKEETFNNAHVLKDFLERKLGGSGSAPNTGRASGEGATGAETQRGTTRPPGPSKRASRGGGKTGAGRRTKRSASARGKASARGGAKRSTRRTAASKASRQPRGKTSGAGRTKRAAGRASASRAGRKSAAGTKRPASRKSARKTSPRTRQKSATGRRGR